MKSQVKTQSNIALHVDRKYSARLSANKRDFSIYKRDFPVVYTLLGGTKINTSIKERDIREHGVMKAIEKKGRLLELGKHNEDYICHISFPEEKHLKIVDEI